MRTGKDIARVVFLMPPMIDLNAAIAVFDKSADRTTPNAQAEAWAVIRAELMRVLDAPVGELYCSHVKGVKDFALSDADGYPIDLKAFKGQSVRLVRETVT